jgi:hypothetical protein
MAQTIPVAYHPELTWEKAMEIFQKHFSGKYRIRKIRRTIQKEFILCKSTFVGVRVRLKQVGNKTSFIILGDAPNALAALCFWLFLGIIPAIIIYLIVFQPKLTAMEKEVKLYIENVPEFNQI